MVNGIEPLHVTHLCSLFNLLRNFILIIDEIITKKIYPSLDHFGIKMITFLSVLVIIFDVLFFFNQQIDEVVVFVVALLQCQPAHLVPGLDVFLINRIAGDGDHVRDVIVIMYIRTALNDVSSQLQPCCGETSNEERIFLLVIANQIPRPGIEQHLHNLFV